MAIAVVAAVLVILTPIAIVAAILATRSGSSAARQQAQATQTVPAGAGVAGAGSTTSPIASSATATLAAEQTAAPATGDLPAAVLFDDLFRDPHNSGLGSAPPADASHYQFSVQNSEFVITVSDPNFQDVPGADLPGVFDDATLAVDARLAASVDAPYVVIGCRAGDSDNGYRFEVDPQNGTFLLTRWANGNETNLVSADSPAPSLMKGGAMNRLALTCAGATIAASINGVQVASVQDATYSSGRFWLGTDWSTGKRGKLEVHFSDLLVTRATAGSPAVLVANALADAERGLLGTDTSDNAVGHFAYAGGDYVITKPRPQPQYVFWTVPDDFADTALTVDARLGGDTANRFVQLGCRSGPTGGYRLVVVPDQGTFSLQRDDGLRTTSLIASTAAAAIKRGQATNRITLVCAGGTITANVNGQQVGQVQDSRFRSGRLSIGVGGDNLTAEGHFRNLVVTQQ